MTTLPEPGERCIYYGSLGCRELATVHLLCSVEGRDTNFCGPHWSFWSREVYGDEPLAKHCPRCAPAFIARREAQAASPSVLIASEPITGPLAEAIDSAMHAEGILAPERQRVLRRLAANTDAYVAAVMSRSAATIV